MTRVPPASRELIPQHLQEAFDKGLRPGDPVPLTNRATLLYSPEACRRAHHWAAYLRNDSTSILPASVRKLAMLVVAREHDSPLIWNEHAASAEQAGLSADLVHALRDKKPLPPLKPAEAAVIHFGQEFYRTHRISDRNFQQALKQFGVQGVAELTMLMGYYAMLAFNAAVFDIDLPEQRTEPLLPV